MGKNSSKADASVNSTTTVSETTNIDIGVTGRELAEILDIVAAGNVAVLQARGVSFDSLDMLPSTSFVPEERRPPGNAQDNGADDGDGNLTKLALVGAAAAALFGFLQA